MQKDIEAYKASLSTVSRIEVKHLFWENSILDLAPNSRGANILQLNRRLGTPLAHHLILQHIWEDDNLRGHLITLDKVPYIAPSLVFSTWDEEDGSVRYTEGADAGELYKRFREELSYAIETLVTFYERLVEAHPSSNIICHVIDSYEEHSDCYFSHYCEWLPEEKTWRLMTARMERREKARGTLQEMVEAALKNLLGDVSW